MRHLFLALAILVLGAVAPGHAKEDEEVGLTLDRVSAPFAKDAKVMVEQKDGKFKEYAPKDHAKFDKDVVDRDLEITELHIKDRKIIKIVFGKKLEEKKEEKEL